MNLRTNANMSQGDLANDLNVSRQSVSKWETNSSVPELEKLVRMSAIFKVSIDEIVRGGTGVISETKNIVNNEQIPQLQLRKIVGVGLLGVGFIIFVLLLALANFLSALILSSPFFVTGLISLLVSKHTALWCGWGLYIVIHQYLIFATGISVRSIFQKGIYHYGLTARTTTAWIMAIILLVLLVSTFRAIKAYKTQKLN